MIFPYKNSLIYGQNYNLVKVLLKLSKKADADLNPRSVSAVKKIKCKICVRIKSILFA